MPNGQPIGRAGKNIFAHGRISAGLFATTQTFGLGRAAYFLIGFTYDPV